MSNRMIIQADQGKQTISRHIYGHFAEHLGRCIYEGLWVGEDSPIPNTRGIRNDVVAALRTLSIPNLRWPGGCFADEYHWMDGIGPREKRPTMINTHWGGVTENNHFGTHEFLDLCEQLGCEPYICGNVGSGTVQEMAQWVEYVNMDGKSPMADLRRANGREKPWNVKWWGVGNESWGCGGNMRPEYYADEFRRYATYCRKYGEAQLYKIACGANGADYRWTEVLMEWGRYRHGLSLHHYSFAGNWGKKGSATDFDNGEWFNCLKSAYRMEELVTRHGTIMDKFDPGKKVGMIVDEWGTWFDVEPGTNPGFLYQQNTIRDAVQAALTLNIFNAHADRVQMANIAQTVNVLQAMVLTEGANMLLTPTYHVFEMYKVHQDSMLLPMHIEVADYTMGEERLPQVSASASRRADGTVNLSLCNLHHEEPAEVTCELRGASFRQVSGRILTAASMNAHNTFAKPETVKPTAFHDFKFAEGRLTISLPAHAVVVLEACDA